MPTSIGVSGTWPTRACSNVVLASVRFAPTGDGVLASAVFLSGMVGAALFGGTGAVIAYSALGRVSGAHINPAMTLAFWMVGKIAWRDATRAEAPIILDEFGNTASAGSLIAFSRHNEDVPAGSYGVMASFGSRPKIAERSNQPL